MKKLSQLLFDIGVVLILSLILQTCAGSGSVANSGGAQEFSRDFEKMTEIVEKAINQSNLGIDYVSESENGDKITLTVSRDRYVGNQEVQQSQGEVRIIKLDQNKTRVEVENPEYHFSVSEHQRADYQRIIFLRIEEMMEGS